MSDAAIGIECRSPHLTSLTSLRGAAALLVVGYHLLPKLEPGVAEALDAVLRQGFLGVGFFFVLSGFVLTWSVHLGDGAPQFYRRRVARIVPAYLVVLVAASTVGIAIGVQDLPSLLFLQAWFPSDRVHFGQLAVAWTLSCEAFFYLVFPRLFPQLRSLSARHRRLGLVAAMAAPALIAWVASVNLSDPTAAWAAGILPLARLPEFVAGCLLAIEVRQGWRGPGPVVAGALAVLAYLVAGQVPALWGTAVMTVPWVLLIAAFARSDRDGGRVLHGRALVALGAWSYALYLVHPLVIDGWARVADRLGRPLQDASGLEGVAQIALVLAGCVVVAFGLWRVLEAPLERRLRPDLVAAVPAVEAEP